MLEKEKGRQGIVTVLFALLCFGAAAASVSEASVLLEEKSPVYVDTRDSRSWKFPAVDPRAGRVVVEFRNRIDYPRTAGWCPCWQIVVNGRILTASASRSETRLLNKPFALRHSWFGEYKADTRSDKWFALYEPLIGASDKCFVPATSEADRFVIDISDVVKRDGENVIRFNASGLSKSFYDAHKVSGHRPAVVFHGLSVRQERGVPTRLPPVVEPNVRATVSPPVVTKFNIAPGEVLAVEVGGSHFSVASRFSIPGGGVAEMRGGKLETPFYSVRRRVERRATHLAVYDTLLSKTNKLIGVKIRHEVASEGFDPVYVAGDASPCAEEFAGGRNPSVFGVRTGRGVSLALLAEDDVFRVQNVQYCKGGFFGIRTDRLALKPGEPRAVEWSVYPMASEDYYDFVNAVRRDWDVNFPIIGSFNLSMNCYRIWTPEKADCASRNMGLGVNTFGCHFWSHIGGKYANYKDCIWGMGKNSSKVRVRVNQGENVLEDPEIMNVFERECIAKCRAWTPHVKVCTYLHDQISVDAGDEKYEDARMVNAKGRKMFYNGGETQKIFVPTAGNLYGRDFMKLTDWYLDTFDVDGIYLDEINHCNSRLYYGDSLWDGASVELDEHNNVRRKVSYVCLLKLDFTMGLFDHILNKRGKLLIGNFSPETRSERKFRFPRFEETYSHRWIALSHLYTPIQLGDMLTFKNNPSEMAADQRTALMRGALYYHYLGDTGCPSLSSKMFPFTPIELHGGWLVGQERILTAVSGDFGWRGEKPDVDVFVFDELGREVPGYPFSVKDTDTGRTFTVELKQGHCAAIIRKPHND